MNAPVMPTTPIWLTEGIEALPSQLAALGERADDAAPVSIIVPGEWVSVHDVVIPARSDDEARDAAPFVLEDDLAADPDTLHFALLGTGNDEGMRRVVVIERAIMQAIHDAVLDAGLTAQAIIPDICLMDDTHVEPHVTECEGRVLVTGGGAAPFAVESDMLSTLAPELVDTSRQFVTRGHMLAEFARRLGPDMPSLLQGRYAVRADFADLLAPWRRVLALAAALGVIWLAVSGLQIWQANTRAQAMEVQAETLLRQAFPDIARVVNPRAQMRARLAALGQGGDVARGSGFLGHVDVLYGALDKVPVVRLESLRYDQDADGPLLTARLTYQAFADVEELRARVERAGAGFSEGAARQRDGRFEGDVVVRVP